MKVIKILKLIAVNLLTFMVLLILVNWGCGVFLKKTGTVHRDQLPNYSNDPAYAKEIFNDYNRVQHRYEPFVGWKMLPYTGKTLHVSMDGRRTHNTGDEVEKKERSVHFFGGSTMWGEGSDDDHTIPALFNSFNPGTEVHNHAQLAYNSRQELDALISLYSENVTPDVVVFYDGVNDAAFLCPKDITELPAHRLVPMYRDKLYTGKATVISGLLSDLFIKNIVKTIQVVTYKPSPDRSPYNCASDPEKAEQIAEMMMRNWEMAHELVTARNGKFLAFLQPAAFIGKPKTDHLKLDEALGENFQEIYRRIKTKIAERNYTWIVDLSDKFDGNEYIYIDFCHVSPNGNEIIAKEISKVVNNNNPVSHVSFLAIHP